jgi:hypothetical protein
MTSYIIAVIFAAFFTLIAALISNAIKFEGGANPQDPKKRKIWFWIMAIINPVVFFLLGAFVIAPNANDDQMVYDSYMAALPIATAVGFVVYMVIGFVLAKMFKNGKIGNWF